MRRYATLRHAKTLLGYASRVCRAKQPMCASVSNVWDAKSSLITSDVKRRFPNVPERGQVIPGLIQDIDNRISSKHPVLMSGIKSHSWRRFAAGGHNPVLRYACWPVSQCGCFCNRDG